MEARVPAILRRLARFTALFLTALLLLGAAGDRRPAGARRPVRAAPPPTAMGTEFVLFGWVSPPAESASAARYTELAGCGLDLSLPPWADQGLEPDVRARLDWGHAAGVRALVWDARTEGVVWGEPEAEALLDSIVADYAGHPGLLGYYFADEPAESFFPELARFYQALRARDPAHPAWDDLRGRVWFSSRAEWEDYARAYVESCGPAVLCDFHYDFLTTGDRGLFVENVAALRAVADEYGLPFWSIVQLVEHGPYRALTPGELRWQVAMLLAYGARGVGYFTYWTPAPDPYWNFQSAVIGWDGRRSPWYDVLAEFNPVVRAAGRALAGATWLGTGHAGSVPRSGLAFVPDDVVRAVEGRAAIGAFAEPGGARLLLVANADSMASRVIALELDSAAVVERLGGADGAWAPQPTNPSSGGRRLELELPSGMFALLRVTGDCAGVHAAGAPREFAVRPNPARGEVRLTFAPRRSATRCDLLDAAGRRVWSGVAGPGAGELVWRGESDAGGSAPPGVYLARVSDPAGVATRRVVWLGAR